MIHVILKSAANVLRLFEEIEVADEKKVVAVFKDRFPDFVFSNAPMLALEEKRRGRSMYSNSNQGDIQQKRHNALLFLTELAKLVEDLSIDSRCSNETTN